MTAKCYPDTILGNFFAARDEAEACNFGDIDVVRKLRRQLESLRQHDRDQMEEWADILEETEQKLATPQLFSDDELQELGQLRERALKGVKGRSNNLRLAERDSKLYAEHEARLLGLDSACPMITPKITTCRRTPTVAKRYRTLN
jgi:hypothetical protein